MVGVGRILGIQRPFPTKSAPSANPAAEHIKFSANRVIVVKNRKAETLRQTRGRQIAFQLGDEMILWTKK